MKIRCPSCGTRYRVASANAGKSTKCSQCEQQFRIPKPADSSKSRRVEIKPDAMGPLVSYDCEHCGQPLLSSCSVIGAPNACPGCEAEQIVPGAIHYEQYLRDAAKLDGDRKLRALREAEKAVAKLKAELAPTTTEGFLAVNGYLPIVPPHSKKVENEKLNLQFIPAIPNGYCIYETEFEIAGLWDHQHGVHQYVSATEHGVSLVPEPNNRADKNSIAAYGIIRSESRVTPQSVQIGYLPSNLASQIMRSELAKVIVPRLRSIWTGGKRSTVIRIDLLGPRDMKPQYG